MPNSAQFLSAHFIYMKKKSFLHMNIFEIMKPLNIFEIMKPFQPLHYSIGIDTKFNYKKKDLEHHKSAELARHHSI